MAKKQPSDADRLVAHALVGLGSGVVVGQKAGFPGFLVGAVAGVIAHVLFDAPLALALAELT